MLLSGIQTVSSDDIRFPTDEWHFCKVNARLLLLREWEILVPGEIITGLPGTQLYSLLRSHMAMSQDVQYVFWWARDAERREMPAVYCRVDTEDQHLRIQALQPALCYPAAADDTEGSGTLLPFRMEEDKELQLRITDLLKDIRDMSPPEAKGKTLFPWFPGLESLTLNQALRLELLRCSSLVDMQERLLPELKRAVETLHATEHLLEVLRGDTYLRPDTP